MPPRGSTKRALSPQPQAGASKKRTGTNAQPVSTAGLTEQVVTDLLLDALAKHPAAGDHVHRARANLLVGITSSDARAILERVGGEYADVEQAITKRREQDSAKAVDFNGIIRQAMNAMHMLDDMRPSKQYMHTGEVVEAVEEHLAAISAKANQNSTVATKIAAIRALVRITAYGLEDTQHEISQALSHSLPASAAEFIARIADTLDQQGRQEALPALEDCAQTMDEHGCYNLDELIEEIKGEDAEEE